MFAQGTFQNLDFEAAVVPAVIPTQPISLTNTLPGWTGYVGTNKVTSGTYDYVSLGAVNIGLIDGKSSYSNFVIEGNFTALLQAGNITPPPPYGSAGIGQTGLIPSTAHSLLFDVFRLEGFLSNFVVTIGGQTLPFSQMGTGQNFTTYGIDVSSYAGQTAELRFTAQPAPGLPDPYTGVMLDNIRFSAVSIPESGVLTLLVFGALFGSRLCVRRRP